MGPHPLRALVAGWRLWRARRALAAAVATPGRLDRAALESLEREFPPVPEYDYGPAAAEARARDRLQRMFRGIPADARRPRVVVDLGSGDGQVGALLARQGARALAVDLAPRPGGGPEGAASCTPLCMDASRLGLSSGCADLVCSFEAFEHFPDPAAVLREACRVTRPEGYVYLEIGPLYGSPRGLHARRATPVPYCQFLFAREILEAHAGALGRPLVPPDFVNGWSLRRWRDLWKDPSLPLRIVDYREVQDVSQIDLIRRFPSCFRVRGNDIDEFLVSTIQVLFRVVGRSVTDAATPASAVRTQAERRR